MFSDCLFIGRAAFKDQAAIFDTAALNKTIPSACRTKKDPAQKLRALFCGVLVTVYISLLWPMGLNAASKVDFGELRAASSKILSVYLLDNDTYSVPPGTDGQLVVETFPASLKDSVRWIVAEQKGSVEFILDDHTGYISVSEDSGVGWINVQAEVDGCSPLSRRIEIGCAGCAAGDLTCKSPAGAGEVAIGSIDVRISLGVTSDGRWAGDLFLYAEEPSAKLSTPEALIINSSSDQVVPLYRDKVLEQIITPETIITFARISPLQYEIYYYDIGQCGEKLDSGLYSIEYEALPNVVWRIQNPDHSGTSTDQLHVTELRGGNLRENLFVYASAPKGWTLIVDNGQRIIEKSEYVNKDGNRVLRRTVSGADSAALSATETVYRRFEFGEKRIREIVDPDGLRLTTMFRYGTDPGTGYGKLVARLNPDGSWVRYQYDRQGRTIREIQPYLDAAIDSPETQCVTASRSYAAVSRRDSRDARDRHKPRLVVETTAGIETARTYHVYIRTQNGGRTEITERCTRQGKPFGHPTNHRWSVSYYGTELESPESGRIKTRLTPEGRLSSYLYEQGQFRISPKPDKCTFIPGEGQAQRITETFGTLKSPEGLAFKTTRTTKILDSFGRMKMQETFVRTTVGFARIDWTLYTHNRQGQVVETLNANHTRTDSDWGCCGKTRETDINGISHRLVYDDFKWVVAKINEATGVTSSYAYDAAGRKLSTVVKGGDLRLVRKKRFDRAGRLVARVDPAGLVTRFNTDKSVFQTTMPSGATEITSCYRDGRIRMINGTAVVPRFYSYGVNVDGTQWTTMALGAKDSPRWEKTTRDCAGRVIRVERPGYVGLSSTRKTYDLKGRLVKIETPAMAPVLYAYDDLGRVERLGLDVDGDGKLTPASMDRIVSTTTEFENIEGDWWEVATRSLWAHDNSDRETIVSVRRKRLSGWDRQIVYEDIAIDIHGNETRSVVSLDRSRRTLTHAVYSHGAAIPDKSIYVDGRLATEISRTGVTRKYSYDAIGRRILTEDSRQGFSRVHYDAKGRIDCVEDASGNRTRYEYDIKSGQRIAEYNALGKATRYEYDLRDQLIRTWGAVPYPAAFSYDEFGQLVTMSTFRSHADWDGQHWPVDAGSPDITQWQYNSATGRLSSKRDAHGNLTAYEYGQGGALASRTWARTRFDRPIRTTYHYDDATGALRRIDYSDDTPAIDFSYDRLGRKIRVSDAAGLHAFSYDEKLQLVGESLTGKQIYQINRHYDRIGRAAGFDLDDKYRISYAYDDKGRIDRIAWDLNDDSGSVFYRYQENSNLLSGIESNTGIAVQYEYDSHQGAKTTVANRFQNRLLSRYEYQLDRLGRRISAKHHGEAYEHAGYWQYTYSDRNEILTAVRYVGDDLADQTKPLHDQYKAFQYDPIGNRIHSVDKNRLTKFSTNRLNQYKTISDAVSRIDQANYDPDGNLTADNRFRYIWDAENRLVAVLPKKASIGAKRLEFGYDYAGRRTAKRVFDLRHTGYELESEVHFIYDGWSLVREVRTSKLDKAVVKSYIWGLDISQTLQGAGGAGGLIARVEGSLTYHYFYDANGNVRLVLNEKTGSIASRCDYDPYGKAVSKGEKLLGAFRFSTKYFDEETDLYYYGFRYYCPTDGRWISRDPLGETGGLNLYGFVSNDPLNFIDPLGLFNWCECFREIYSGIEAGTGEFVQNLWDFISLKQFAAIKQTYEAVKGLAEDVIKGNLSAIAEAFFPDIYVLTTQWDQLEEKRCFYIGKVAGEYGISAATSGGAAKVLSILRKLKMSNKNIRVLSGSEKRLIITKKPVVIGENMRRVQHYADEIGAHAYKPWKNDPFNNDLGMRRNKRWINDMKREGRMIIDIGPDYKRRNLGAAPSEFYNLERSQLKSYDNYFKVFERNGKSSGGVKGLDY